MFLLEEAGRASMTRAERGVKPALRGGNNLLDSVRSGRVCWGPFSGVSRWVESAAGKRVVCAQMDLSLRPSKVPPPQT
jgi:hypothetical protein